MQVAEFTITVAIAHFFLFSFSSSSFLIVVGGVLLGREGGVAIIVKNSRITSEATCLQSIIVNIPFEEGG